MSVDETPWEGICPRCGDRDPNHQCPVTIVSPRPCVECPHNPWRDAAGNPLLLYYTCTVCGQRYLTPKVPAEDLLLELMKP